MCITNPRVIIVGSGFAGLWAAKILCKARVSLLMIDTNNFHTFLPLLYQVATAGIEPEAITYPIRGILRNLPGARFLQSAVNGVDQVNKVVKTNIGDIPYDYLLIATGSKTAYYNIPGAEQYSFSLKTVDESILVRNHILRCLERASHETDPLIRRQLLTFTVVGGGATGVEFAGAMAELVNGPVFKDYPEINKTEIQIILIESTDGILNGFPNRLRTYALKRLGKMGVLIKLRHRVTQVSAEALFLKDTEPILTRTIVWLAGICGNPPFLTNTGDGRFSVNSYLQITGDDSVFPIGDIASFKQDGNILPMAAPVAIQQGIAAARNIIRKIKDIPSESFLYRDKGAMVTIGRNAAVAKIGKFRCTGFLAWIIWLGLHLYMLIGFRNRLLVLINWAWDYFLIDKAIRIILPTAKFCSRSLPVE